MKAKRRFNIWLWVLLCVPCLLTSCDHDVHDGKEESGLSVSLTWADEADQGTEVKDVKLWIFNADNGSLVEEKHYGSAQEVASQRFQLPEGTYRILTTTNLTEPFFISEQTRALTNWNNILIGLTNPKNVRNNAYFGVTDVKIANKEGSYVVQNPMKSVLAELTIIIENIPKGTEMSGKVLDCAGCLFPTQKNSDGDYGLPSIEPTEVELPTLLATESTLKSEVIRLMPTIQGSPASHVYLRLLLPNGTLQEFDITAPKMNVGGKYELRFKYEEMQPKMNLQTGINDWNDLNKEVTIK
ncbi:FimB/Mfa2 family fimbrial subunit [Segatella copri]|uniref:FimB/Mfa2 family fimbrial subunit n=1 Tax=Segatella copri TaxID=165179 RepID=A0AA90ZTX6_9BACT|nr:FimB/Mfa2 family fimbrial subunit [Segatella copri]MQN70210.1 FimB/Mfa2 family fimbrial subunit [Segatella copri]MQN77037.1 FimB/Mfa2 family fimbrial subunit [Segatella copri]MQO01869.1 FimB/Mfa2 family fimbrial subunit [Segatella copri]